MSSSVDVFRKGTYSVSFELFLVIDIYGCSWDMKKSTGYSQRNSYHSFLLHQLEQLGAFSGVKKLVN